jgi:hypothetical protein
MANTYNWAMNFDVTPTEDYEICGTPWKFDITDIVEDPEGYEVHMVVTSQ